MKRKINRVGKNTLTVSLPASWTKKNNIKAGDELETSEENKSIRFGIEKPKVFEKEIDIEIKHNDWRLVRSTIGSLYKKGYYQIRIKYTDENILKHIKNAVNSLIGYEIVDMKKGYCMIKNFLVEKDDEVWLTIFKLLNLIKTSSEYVRQTYINSKFENMKEIDDYRNYGWMLRDYTLRMIGKFVQEPSDMYSLSIITWSLEKINRNYLLFYREAVKSKPKLKKDILAYFDRITALIEILNRALTKKEFSDFEKMNKEHDYLIEKGKELLEKNPEDGLLIFLLMENIRRVQDTGSSINMLAS